MEWVERPSVKSITATRRRLGGMIGILMLGLALGPLLAAPMRAASFDGSEWSVPVNLVAVNSAFRDNGGTLSPDGSLYFLSFRPGGFGLSDLWVSRRDGPDGSWVAPVNLGAGINGPGSEVGPALSIDGHIMFFSSDRPGGYGSDDIYVSRRANPHDDFGWGAPVLLGPAVNTAAVEQAPHYQQSASPGGAQLCFNRAIGAGAEDLYCAPVTREGDILGAAAPVSEANTLAREQGASLRVDNREMFFASNRAGGIGAFDIYSCTRQNPNDSWSVPENVATLNSAAADFNPSLSFDGRTIVFTSLRAGGLGDFDLWMSRRTPSGK